MTRTKKIVSVLLALVMAFSMPLAVFAAPAQTAAKAEEVNPFLYMEKTEIIEYISGLEMNSVKQLITVTCINIAFFFASIKFSGFDLSPYKDKTLGFVWNMVKGHDRAASAEAVAAVSLYREALEATKKAENVNVKADTAFNVKVTKSGSQEIMTDAAFKTLANAFLTDANKSVSKSDTFKKGVSITDAKVTIASLVKPAGENGLKASTIAGVKQEKIGDYTRLEMTLVEEHSVYNGKITDVPTGNCALIEPFDATTLVAGFAKVSYADTVYTGTKLTVTINGAGLIEKIEVSAPFTTDYEGKVTLGSLMAIAMKFTAAGSYADVYTFTY